MNSLFSIHNVASADGKTTIRKILRDKIIKNACKDFQSTLSLKKTKFFGDLTDYTAWNPDDKDDKFFLMTDYAFFWNINPISIREGKNPTSTVYIFRFGGNRGDLLIPKSYFSGMKVEDFVNKIYEKNKEYEEYKQQKFTEFKEEQYRLQAKKRSSASSRYKD